MLIFKLFESDFNIFLKLALLIVTDKHNMLDSSLIMRILLLIEIKGHCMVFCKILDFSVLIDKLAFLIFEFLFRDDPIIIQFFSIFLEISQQFLFLFRALLKFSQLFPQS